MKLIAAVDKNWAIGFKGKLLASIRADQMNFKKLTLGKVVVLGRKTMDTFPGGRPLAQRRNIILSRNPEYKVKDAEVVHSKEELLELIVKEKINSFTKNSCLYAIRLSLPRSTTAMRPMHISPIWIRTMNGNVWRKARSRRALIWNSYLQGMKGKSLQSLKKRKSDR